MLFRFGRVIAFMQILAGIFDGIENYGLIRLLFGSDNATFAAMAFFFATLKFTFIVMGILYFLVAFITHKFLMNTAS